MAGRPRQDTGLRLLSYARVSAVRGREGPGFISESDRFGRNRSYAETYGHTIVDEGSDEDVSRAAYRLLLRLRFPLASAPVPECGNRPHSSRSKTPLRRAIEEPGRMGGSQSVHRGLAFASPI
jgi:hypothetical protein